MSSVLVLILLFTCTLHLASTAHRSHHKRRFLHQPLFPSSLMPPSPSPTSSPAQKQQPKLPASDSPATAGKSPFFPSYTSPSAPPPPPPPSSDVPTTFPANISSLVLPQSPSPRKSSSTKLLALTTVALSATLASVIILILCYRRRSYRFSLGKASRSDSLRLYPANSAPSDGGCGCLKPPRRGASGTNSEFLYLGTLVSPRGGADECNVNTDSGTVSPSVAAYHKLGSPELLPLPPLPRKKAHQNVSSADASSSMGSGGGGADDEEVFYSPRGSSSSAGKETAFQAVEVENLGSRSFNSPARSYPSSNTASPTSHSTLNHTPSPPKNSSPRRSNSKSPDSFVKSLPPPLRPPPPAPSRGRTTVLTPSPGRESPARISDFLQPSAQSPERVGGVGVFSGQEHSPKVPPPPPPPPLGYGETLNAPKVSREPYPGPPGPPILIRPSRHVLSQNGVPLISQGGQSWSGDYLMAGEDSSKPKLKPLHWDKVRASSDRAMVWDLLRSNSFKLDEETIETLFTVNGPNSMPKENPRHAVLTIPSQENQMLDPKKSQNIAILLRALNATVDEVCETILEGNADTLGTEFLESLLKMAPTVEEERKLKDFKDGSPVKLGPAERFLRAVIDIPFAFRRVEAMLYIANFDPEVDYLKRAFETLLVACEELKNSKMFLKLLEAVLKTGNRMNVGTSRGDAHAFKLDTLLKLVDVKGADGKTTLLHFVVQEIIRTEGARPSNPANHSKARSDLRDDLEFRKHGLQVVSRLSNELTNVKKAATMDSEALSNDAGKLAGGVAKVKEVVKLMGQLAALEGSDLKFCESMHAFLDRAGVEIAGIQTHQKAAFSSVKDLTVYFHGNSAREEAHPLRIFMVVRDFLSTLNKVCKEVGKINERSVFSSAIFSSGRQLTQHSNPSMPPFVEFNRNHQPNSSAEESSSSSSTTS